LLVMLGRFFDKMDIFNNFHAKPRDIVTFLILGCPYWLNLVLPIATMLALLFSLGAFQQRGELTAFRSAGISSYRLFLPFIAVAVALSAISLLGGMTFLPKINFRAHTVYRVKIKQGQALNYRKDRVVAAGSRNRLYSIGWLDLDHQRMNDVVVDRFGARREWLETISAQQAVYENGHWVFHDGSLRRVDPKDPANFVEERFTDRVVDLDEKPSDFVFEDKSPDDMTGREILMRIDRLRRLGVATFKEQVAFHMRLALPWANVVVVLLGIPFALRSGRHGRPQTFAYALGVAFFYWGLTSVCQSFGEAGRMPAWMAAWMANAGFSVIGIGLLRQVV
ncbi:MAG TPA: LptF/LptG family permease, partial [Elusimicrobiota bacterium]|nr:LptF/LptG family permease [Elusimicrobiota bacterium]